MSPIDWSDDDGADDLDDGSDIIDNPDTVNVDFDVDVLDSTSSSSSSLPCQYCVINNATCPVVAQAVGSPFPVNYTYRSSTPEYPFSVRTLSVVGEPVFRQCVYGPASQAVPPVCANLSGGFTTLCPEGAATRFEDGIPVADVPYKVTCLSSQLGGFDGCSAPPESWRTCSVKCMYCLTDQDLVFNVTAPTRVDECQLHMWYNTTGGRWCQIFPEKDESCIGAYGEVYEQNNGIVKMSSVTPNIFSVFHLTSLVAPSRYKWNVECSTFYGTAYATEDWAFNAKCPK